MNYLKTFERVEVKDYPYGFKLRTTLYDYLEFDIKKGYRHVTQTINPKNGKLNAPKKGTYSPLIVRYYNEDGHIKTKHFHFNGDKELNEGCQFVGENFDLFTPEEIKYLYTFVQMMAVVDMKATVIYGGASVDDLKPLYNDFMKLCKKGYETGENLFKDLKLDSDAIEATKPEDFNPFKVREFTPQ